MRKELALLALLTASGLSCLFAQSETNTSGESQRQ